jgi:hypothetical protein
VPRAASLKASHIPRNQASERQVKEENAVCGKQTEHHHFGLLIGKECSVSHGNRGILAGHLGTCDGPYDETNENDGIIPMGPKYLSPDRLSNVRIFPMTPSGTKL